MLVGIVMGSKSDWEEMKKATYVLKKMEIPYEAQVVSAHRTPDVLFEYATNAEGRLDCIIAGAGGAAHLPGMLAAKTIVPILGVPIKSSILNGIDSLLSIVQMPTGIPVATFNINGADNAALFATEMLARYNTDIAINLKKWRSHQTDQINLIKLD